MAIIKSVKSLRGAHVPHRKNTHDFVSEVFNDVDTVTILMQQHMGVPCTPCVKMGDLVKLGDVVGNSDEYFSVPVHATCSGKVLRIIDLTTVSGKLTKAVVIENDKQYTLSENITIPKINDRADLVNAVKASGVVGLGGAGFPLHVKLDYKNIQNITKLVINAAECEPYITSDYRECMENTQNVIDGISAIKKYLNISDVYIAIETNKPQAIERFGEMTEDKAGFNVVKLKQIYPQGAEKSVIYAATGVVVEEGKLPADCGVLVMNVSTAGFLGKYLKDGIPLVEKRITVDGDCIQSPKNLIVPIGTRIKDVLDYCKIDDEAKKILMGGPMMGITVSDIEMPIVKNNNAILAFSSNEIKSKETSSCIRCGRCISTCPMKLMPTSLEKAYDAHDSDELTKLKLNLCMNCGCCTYVCPAKRNLAQKNQLAKGWLRKVATNK